MICTPTRADVNLRSSLSLFLFTLASKWCFCIVSLYNLYTISYPHLSSIISRECRDHLTFLPTDDDIKEMINWLYSPGDEVFSRTLSILPPSPIALWRRFCFHLAAFQHFFNTFCILFLVSDIERPPPPHFYFEWTSFQQVHPFSFTLRRSPECFKTVDPPRYMFVISCN